MKMNEFEAKVANHYGDTGLLARIIDGLKAGGADLDRLRPDDLAPVDEFHIGGRRATVHAMSKMALQEGMQVLDVGCGIGGTARYITSSTGCRVTGVDLTPDYISVATSLTQMTGLADMATFHVASALDMPFEAKSFDAAVTFHVAMNIQDRETLYREIARVMKPGAQLCIYDVMKKSDEPLKFPAPWSETPSTSHLVSPEEMHALLGEAGLAVEISEDRTGFAIEFFRNVLATATEGPPPLGIHLLMGTGAPDKIRNTLENLEAGRIAPVLMIARR